MAEDKTRGHETTDMDPKYVFYFATGLVLVAVVIHVGIWWVFQSLVEQRARRDAPAPLVQTETKVPEPRLQVFPQADYENMLRQENETLGKYEWIDREKGTARIPIERAMQIFVEREKK